MSAQTSELFGQGITRYRARAQSLATVLGLVTLLALRSEGAATYQPRHLSCLVKGAIVIVLVLSRLQRCSDL